MPRKQQPTELSEREKLIDTFVRCFESAEGKVVLSHLKATYQDTSSIFGHGRTGVIDTNWTLVHAGCRQVYLYIKELIEEGLNARAGRNTGNASADEPSIWDL